MIDWSCTCRFCKYSLKYLSPEIISASFSNPKSLPLNSLSETAGA